MIFVAHRGNLYGPSKDDENAPSYLQKALDKQFDIEIDVWWHYSGFWLGHDYPQYVVSTEWLRQGGIWAHAKNPEAAIHLIRAGICCFNQDIDRYSITSNGWIWFNYDQAKVNRIVIDSEPVRCNAIAMLYQGQPIPEGVMGVCSDYVYNLRWGNNAF